MSYLGFSWIWNAWIGLGELPPYELIPSDQSQSRGISPVAILAAMALAIALAFVLSAAKNHKLLNRAARLLKITRKFGDRDVWSYVMNETGTP